MVSEDSATAIGTKISIATDHSNLVKFTGIKDVHYLALQTRLESLVSNGMDRRLYDQLLLFTPESSSHCSGFHRARIPEDEVPIFVFIQTKRCHVRRIRHPGEDVCKRCDGILCRQRVSCRSRQVIQQPQREGMAAYN